jgi:hypothetical protein
MIIEILPPPLNDGLTGLPVRQAQTFANVHNWRNLLVLNSIPSSQAADFTMII